MGCTAGPRVLRAQWITSKKINQSSQFQGSPLFFEIPITFKLSGSDCRRKRMGRNAYKKKCVGKKSHYWWTRKPLSLLGGQYATMSSEENFQTKEDPGFVDMQQENFLLKPDSKIFSVIPGFEPVPFDKMGLYQDKYRNK